MHPLSVLLRLSGLEAGSSGPISMLHATCAADGCERPFAWRELHHRRPWSPTRQILETRHVARVLRRLIVRCCLLWSHDLRLT